MQSMSDPLSRLHADAAWFARAHEVKLLWVRASGDLRAPALKLLPMLEFHADNFSPWVVLEDAHTPRDDGWQTRANRLMKDWERRREAFAKDGVEMPMALPPSSQANEAAHLPRHALAGGTDGGPGRLAVAARTVCDALRSPLRGLVLVLAPAVVDDAEAFAAEVSALLVAPGLSTCRWVVVVDADVQVPHWFSAMGDRALGCECVINPAQKDEDLAALLGGVEGGAVAKMGVARPRGAVPPRRVGAPPEIPIEQRDAALHAAGVEPAMLEQAPRVRALVLGAAIAMKNGHGIEAVRLQREAKDLCVQLKLDQLAVICHISLASYLSGLNQRSQALAEAETAVEYAVQRKLKQPESQACLAVGLLHALAKRLPDAARAYAAAARAAEEAGASSLAIEAWRLSGQLALEAGIETQAIKCFSEALRIASGSTPAVVQSSGAAEVARRLSAVFRAHGQDAQAASLDAQADRMEAGKFGTSPAGAAATPEA